MNAQPPSPPAHDDRATPLLQVRGVRRCFGRMAAVDGVDLDVRRGEVLALAGPNGAGKTTLMHLIAGLSAPDLGEVVVAGLCDPTRPRVRRELGVATQALALYGELTAEENVAFFARLHGIAAAEASARVTEALTVVGLTARCADRARTLSGGMQRRLNLACALVHRPALLLLDEPTAGVDPQSRDELLRTIEGLARRGHAIVFATHHLEEAARICHRVAIMHRGRIVALDTIEKVTAGSGGDLERAVLSLTRGSAT